MISNTHKLFKLLYTLTWNERKETVNRQVNKCAIPTEVYAVGRQFTISKIKAFQLHKGLKTHDTTIYGGIKEIISDTLNHVCVIGGFKNSNTAVISQLSLPLLAIYTFCSSGETGR